MSATASTALWYASRSTGVVALVMLTAVLVLGILVNRKRSLPGLPRFATAGLHRSLSLLAAAFVAVHVITAIADPYVTIGVAAAVVPFTSPYETFWIGLGAVAIDLMIALVATSLLRARIGRRTWRGVHWLAYATWPVALAHSFGSSTDLRHGYLLWLAIACICAVLGAAGWRLLDAVTAPRCPPWYWTRPRASQPPGRAAAGAPAARPPPGRVRDEAGGDGAAGTTPGPGFAAACVRVAAPARYDRVRR